ncbi:hypothetical protein KW787_03460 [Candidatus Pacearchaeota archaeon]|nr:hypothetical protein [Candidatus Pacearchaeota archaeon]
MKTNLNSKYHSSNARRYESPDKNNKSEGIVVYDPLVCSGSRKVIDTIENHKSTLIKIIQNSAEKDRKEISMIGRKYQIQQ